MKTKNLLKRPQVSLLILDFSDPMRYLEVRGTAKSEPDPDKRFAQKVGAKYGADLAAWDEPGAERVIVTIEPEHLRSGHAPVGPSSRWRPAGRHRVRCAQ